MANGYNTDGPAGAMAAMQRAAHPASDDTDHDASAVDSFAREAAIGAHDRLDGHDADIAALKAHTGLDADSDTDS
jgi:hypothetical protein